MDQPTMLRATTILGLSASTFQAGIYFASSRMVLPILYRFPAAVSTDIFSELYHRGLPIVATLSVVAGVSYGTSAYLNSQKRAIYSIAAALSVAALPWTVLVMSGNIEKLLEMAANEQVRTTVGQAGAVAMLKTWEWQNMVRSAFSLAGGLSGLFVLAGIL